jgi:hypothetical protein
MKNVPLAEFGAWLDYSRSRGTGFMRAVENGVDEENEGIEVNDKYIALKSGGGFVRLSTLFLSRG